MKPETFNKLINSNLAINADILWLILSLVLFLFIIFSSVLFFHWHRFGRRALAVGTAEVIYLGGSIFLLLGAAASIMLF